MMEGGGAVCFVSNNYTGWLTIKNSTLHDNPSVVWCSGPSPTRDLLPQHRPPADN